MVMQISSFTCIPLTPLRHILTGTTQSCIMMFGQRVHSNPTDLSYEGTSATIENSNIHNYIIFKIYVGVDAGGSWSGWSSMEKCTIISLFEQME